MKRAIAMFAKAPRAGEVKTRLGDATGHAQAAALAAAFIEDTVARIHTCAQRVGASSVVFYTPSSARAEMAPLLGGSRCLPQASGGLGKRLHAAVATLRRQGFQHIVLLGSDSPTLPSEIIYRAFDALDREADVAIAKAADGGYVLLAVNDTYEALFDDIPWSTDSVYDLTLARARASSLHTVELHSWYDVDDGASLDRLRAELNGSEPLGDDAPRTRAALKRIAPGRRPLG